MKMVLDDRTKHRIAGVIVILAMAIIFLPEMINTASHTEDQINLSLRIPARPPVPSIAVPTQQALLKTVKVAHVDIPAIAVQHSEIALAKAQSLVPQEVSNVALVDLMPKNMSVITTTKTQPLASTEKIAPTATSTPLLPKTILVATATKKLSEPLPSLVVKQVAQNMQPYSIQLAAFSREKNAQAMIKRLRAQGYGSSYYKSGNLFHVLVGKEKQKDQAVRLQQKLLAQLNLQGLIVRGTKK